ncbi:MAG TPA: hypothetical protein VGO00_03940 [Kofleriaceae bacterium]|jgi:hypothetical protein|nr:hypothetical protein [Kofleriaceae bacterium]
MRIAAIAFVLCSLGSLARAGGEDPAVTALEKALPRGWTVLATDTELVIRHDRACYVAADVHDASGPLVTLELRYHLQPKWTPQQLADAKATNDKVTAQIAELRKQYKIDAIKATTKPTIEEKSRLATYTKGETELRKQLVKVPICNLGDASLFDGDDTYAQLKLKVDPPEAMQQAKDIVELVKKQCGAS